MEFKYINNNTRFEASYQLLVQGIENKIIYNADLNEIKFLLGRAFSDEKRQVSNLFSKSETGSVEHEIYWILPYQLNHCKSAINKINKLKIDEARRNKSDIQAALSFLEEGKYLWDLITEAKQFVVKGRKPSANPRKTPPRTLENTGTCGCCGKNVKMNEAGELVAHGYTIRWGFQQGNCFGVGYPPHEVSPKCAQDYLKLLRDTEKTLERALDRYGEGFSRDKRMTEAELTNVRWYIKRFDETVTNWKATPLPR